MLKTTVSVLGFVLFFACNGIGQNVVGFPELNQIDSITFELSFKTDTAAIVTVHVAQDSLYRNAFIFLGRTVGSENYAAIELNRLVNNTEYFYRLYLGTELSSVSGKFSTGNLPKK
ncbi:MAG: hypothetical protein ACPGD8_03545 [Flavobacteriales bacterium]